METTKWALDPNHSEIQFKVKHLLISTVTGAFKKFSASVETEGDNLATAKVQFEADMSSIWTNNDMRDTHLAAADFFDVSTHPEMTFTSDKLEKVDADNYKAHGVATLRGISKPITLQVAFGGLIEKDPWGGSRMGFSVSGVINRKDFGIAPDTNAAGLGENVIISAEVQFVKQAALELA